MAKGKVICTCTLLHLTFKYRTCTQETEVRVPCVSMLFIIYTKFMCYFLCSSMSLSQQQYSVSLKKTWFDSSYDWRHSETEPFKTRYYLIKSQSGWLKMTVKSVGWPSFLWFLKCYAGFIPASSSMLSSSSSLPLFFRLSFSLLFFSLLSLTISPFSLLWNWKMDWCCWRTALHVWWMRAVLPEREGGYSSLYSRV